MGKRVTIMDIAHDCGLSKSTVGYALNSSTKDKVSLAKRKLIHETALKLGYQTNIIARGLSSQKSYTIGVLLPSPLDNFYAYMVAKIQHLLIETDYSPLFAFWEKAEDRRKAFDNILSRRVDAVITCEPSYLPDDIKIPVVSYSNNDRRFDYVGYCPEKATKIRLDYLMDLGHTKIAYIGRQNCLRSRVFHRLVKEYGIVNIPEWNQGPELREMDVFSGGGISLEKIWKQKERPSAIIAHCDAVAIGAIRKAWELGIKIPDDLSIIGFDDILHARYCTPALTTAGCEDVNIIAEVMVETILDRLKDKTLTRIEHIIQPKLIIRESCGKANS